MNRMTCSPNHSWRLLCPRGTAARCPHRRPHLTRLSSPSSQGSVRSPVPAWPSEHSAHAQLVGSELQRSERAAGPERPGVSQHTRFTRALVHTAHASSLVHAALTSAHRAAAGHPDGELRTPHPPRVLDAAGRLFSALQPRTSARDARARFQTHALTRLTARRGAAR